MFKRSIVMSAAAVAALTANLVTTTPAAAVDGGAVVTNTAANRAVARVYGAGSCTGTLVAPNTVLTAGHCIRHPEPNPPLHEPNWKKDPDRLNHEDWEQPGRFYQLYGHPNGVTLDFGPDATRPVYRKVATHYAIATSTDSVLLRFATPLTAAQATPVPVLTRTPGPDPTFWNSKLLTIMGYGGTNTLTSGTFRTLSSGAATCTAFPNYICSTPTGSWNAVHGDSGGPQFWTDPAGQRWLIASHGMGEPGSAAGVRTSHRGAVRTSDRFPDQQEYYDRILGAADIAFARVNAAGTFVAGTTQVAQGLAPSVTHPSTGIYNVVLPKVAGANTVIATADGPSRANCQVRNANGASHVVECFHHTGTRTDAAFSILSTTRWADARATVAANGTSPVVTSGAAPGSTSKPTVSRTGVGRYTVSFPNMTGALGNVMVSALQGSGQPVKCNVVNWATRSANVVCTSPRNVAADHGFSVVGARKDDLEKRSDMFAWANNPTSAQYSTPAGYSQMNDGLPVAQRLGVGSYRIRFNGAQNTLNGVWMASAYGIGGTLCGINTSTFYADISCTGANGAAVDTMYVVRYLKPMN